MSPVVGIEREQFVRVSADDIHHVAYDDGRRFLTMVRPYRKRPRDFELTGIVRRNLFETGKTRVGVILRRHHPLLVIAHQVGRLLRNRPGVPASKEGRNNNGKYRENSSRIGHAVTG
jgi:hypothetical protein